jgi:hypothetical protein
MLFCVMLAIALFMANEVAIVAEEVRSASSFALSFCEASSSQVFC